MSENENNQEETKAQHKVYDHLFIAIFGKNDERSKRWRLELYNALNNTNYSDPDALELNTLENVIFIKMHNDVSFLVDSQMTLYEHQRSVNPNMPLRGFFYFSQLYQKYLTQNEKLIGSSTLIKIPNPNFIVFYNGDTPRDEDYELKLSDAFIVEDKSGKFEWTARVLNINKGYNLSLQKKCKSLYDYIIFIDRINENQKVHGMNINQSVDEAGDWASEQNLLEGYIKEQKAEVKAMLLTEYDEEAYKKLWRREGLLEGRLEGRQEGLLEGRQEGLLEGRQEGLLEGRQNMAEEAAVNLLKMNKLSPDEIAQGMNLPLEKVLELQKSILVEA